MARRPDCNKFTGKNTEEDPEVTTDPEIGSTGTVTMTVKIVNQCEECSTELEENEFELEGEANVSGHEGDGHELECGEPEVERTDSGGGRYAKRMFGVEAKVPVSCSCGKLEADVVMKDEIASSHMESLV